ncbi:MULTISPECIES: bifunctional 2-polyprenyl-6-hydroxyphenol methylase/3-demethylubiquinol 3-O-methyltransferase UbiG [unclassified Bradyrhizobium]|uniref:class I SAM-dependent methyltransferase n=1 Tax=unclassified Bradyrhizobium TaxID=2631580 RepID=UPI0017E6752A|nr:MULTISPECIES: methyltransferase domain-containing protein [unclassified Bradyrhizobium]MBB4256487.1 SAM-dependent methyltransferase [Bradyrhizobium sp. CIR3A]NYG43487.1 SAM-dependent methyltransferase [Bradyrhizobium sp. IAR9]
MTLEAARRIQIDDMQGRAGAAQDTAAQSYYIRSRREIRSLLPSRASRILEVGPGAGFTLAWLKSIYSAATTFGVELNQELEADLKLNADVAMIGDIDDLILRVGSKFDLILLLDILEHVPDPTRTLQAITRNLLMDGGRVIVSVPNIAHLSVTLPLLFQRRFEYTDSGILDRTHLKFFVEGTAVRLLNDSGLVVKDGLVTGIEGPRSKMLDRLTFGGLTHHLAKQYIMAGELTTASTAQPKINWKKNRLIS